MRIVARKTMPKVCGEPTQNEDVFVPKHSKPNKPFFRFVMCDGATTSFSGRAWAQALSASLFKLPKKIEGEIDDLFFNNLKDSIFLKCFRRASESYEKSVNFEGLSFFKQEAFKRGSAATMLLLMQKRNDSSALNLTAIGDTCFFVVNQTGKVEYCFPIDDSTAFSTSAYLVDSRRDFQEKILFAPETRSLYWRSEDVNLSEWPESLIVCATDAVSQWIVAKKERQENIKELLDAVRHRNSNAYHKFILSCRQAKMMPVDDSTIVVLER